MKSKLSILGFVLILSALIVSGCGATTAEPTAGLANPAAVYCEEQGYTLEIRTDADGGQYGVCIFPDGSECEEWAFYRGECSPASEAAVETPAAEEPTAVPAVTPTEVAVETPGQTPTGEVIQPSEMVSLDETWNQYVNYRLGFSIKFPKTMVTFYGSCRWNEENGDHSYRPDPAIVPVKVFEDVDTVYIAGEYYHELAGETTETTADGGMRYYYAECNKVNNSLALLQDPENHYQQMWKMVVKDIYNDDELDGFIKSRYGAGCSLGEKVASEQQDGVYDVRIQGDGKDLPETQCPLNYGTVLKYYPQANRVIAWDLGQAYTFAAD